MFLCTVITAVAGLRVEVHHEESSSPLPLLHRDFEMVQEQIRASGRITPGVYATVQKLSEMIATIIEPSIHDAHVSDQMLVHLVASEVAMCDASYAKFADGELKRGVAGLRAGAAEVGKGTGTMEEQKARYAKCLDDRDLLVRHNGTVCCQAHAVCPGDGYGDCDVVTLSAGFVGCDYTTRTGAECFKAARDLVSPLEGYFQSTYEKYHTLQTDCNQLTAALKAKVSECSYLQEAVNSHVSEVNSGVQRLDEASSELAGNNIIQCIDYRDCRQASETVYNKTVGPCAREDGAYGSDPGACVMVREADRHREWESTQVIKCMLDHYCAGGVFEEELMEKCKQEISEDHLRINYPKLPTEIDCDDADFPEVETCTECVDRPYYQYEQPCLASPPQDLAVCMEPGECPEWCAGEPSE